MQRLNILALSAILLVLLLLVNGQKVQIQIFFIQTIMPLSVVMAVCVGIGIALTLLFLHLGRSFKKMVARIKKSAHL